MSFALGVPYNDLLIRVESAVAPLALRREDPPGPPWDPSVSWGSGVAGIRGYLTLSNERLQHTTNILNGACLKLELFHW
jgi:hypothetical protein